MPVRLLTLKFCISVTAALSVLALTMASHGEENSPPKPSVKIAALYNVTGGMASIDAGALNGARLAAKLANGRGGVLGGRMIDIVAFDTKTDLKAASLAAQAALKSGAVAGVGYGDSDFVLAAAPHFQVQRTPFVTSGATDPTLRDRIGDRLFLAAFGDRLFLAAFGDDDQAAAMALFARERLKAGRAVLLTDSAMDFAKSLSRFFRQQFTARGGRILEEAFFKSGDKDFSGLVARLKAAQPEPDCVFISGGPQEAPVLVRQIREAGITMPILSGDGFDTDIAASIPDPRTADRIFFSTHSFAGESRPEALSFEAAYRREYGASPPNAFAALGYDATGLVIDAIGRAGATEANRVTLALARTVGYKAATGLISYTARPGIPVKPVSIVGIEKGKQAPVGTWKETDSVISYSP